MSKLRQRIITALLIMGVLLIFGVKPSSAAYLSGRNITVQTPVPGAITTYTINFSLASSGTLGSIKFEFCDNSPLHAVTCNAASGMDSASATLSGQTGETGFILDPLSAGNVVILSRAPALVSNSSLQYVLSNMTNPSLINSTIYMRISTYASNDASGPLIDEGAATFSTSGQLGAAAFVPPHLFFCVGVTVAGDCSSVSGNYANFGDFSISQVRSVTTQAAAGTNDPDGYTIFIFGNTLTSGNNIIPAISSQTPSLPGLSQFGINLVANSNPNMGQPPSGAGSGSVSAGYNTANLFKFSSGDAIASAPSSTDYNVYTVTYIGNISSSQPIGVYSTSINFTAVATF